MKKLTNYRSGSGWQFSVRPGYELFPARKERLPGNAEPGKNTG